MHISHFAYPLTCRWTPGRVPPFGHCEQRRDEHGRKNTRILAFRAFRYIPGSGTAGSHSNSRYVGLCLALVPSFCKPLDIVPSVPQRWNIFSPSYCSDHYDDKHVKTEMSPSKIKRWFPSSMASRGRKGGGGEGNVPTT